MLTWLDRPASKPSHRSRSRPKRPRNRAARLIVLKRLGSVRKAWVHQIWRVRRWHLKAHVQLLRLNLILRLALQRARIVKLWLPPSRGAQILKAWLRKQAESAGRRVLRWHGTKPLATLAAGLAGAAILFIGSSFPVGEILAPLAPLAGKRAGGKQVALEKGGERILGTAAMQAYEPVELSFPDPALAEPLDWRPSPYPVPLSIRAEDHFYLLRPIPSGEVNWALSTYRYGSTYKGRESIHTGVDLGAELGTEVIAAGPGEVVWSGYGMYAGMYDPDDPYGLSVAIRHTFGYRGLPMYTLYAHMATVAVDRGDRVESRDVIGSVGLTGKTTGPHLHFEVRIGSNSYYATRNPELWMTMPQGWGVLAGRVTGTYGRLLTEHTLTLRSIESGDWWIVETYAPLTVNADEGYEENFAISDLPSGPYEVSTVFYGRRYSTTVFVHPGQANFIEFRGRSGFRDEQVHAGLDLTQPPYP